VFIFQSSITVPTTEGMVSDEERHGKSCKG
jgi:hypothetical protein